MGKQPRTHSVEIKAKISSSLRRLWSKRLKSKRLGGKFFLSWTESIAKAAKDGGMDGQRLNWDSYNEIEQEITRQQLRFATEKALAKELAKIKSATVAKEKAEKIAILAQRKKEREEKARAELRHKARRRTAKKREKSPVTQEFILKQKLVKIRRKKPTSRKVIREGGPQISSTPIWGKLDFELTEREELKRDSLADQIQAGRTKEVKSNANQHVAAAAASEFS